MSLAIDQAELARELDEVPVGCVITSAEGDILGVGHNLKEESGNPCGHAEILALERAGNNRGDWRLSGAVVFVTLEPCPMCLAAMVHARIDTLVFGAYDSKGGAISLGYYFYKDKKLNHTFNVLGGFNHYEHSKIMSQFFREKRKSYQNKNSE